MTLVAGVAVGLVRQAQTVLTLAAVLVGLVALELLLILFSVLPPLLVNLSGQSVFMLVEAAGDSLPGAQEDLAEMVAVEMENLLLMVMLVRQTLVVAVAVLQRPTALPVALV